MEKSYRQAEAEIVIRIMRITTISPRLYFFLSWFSLKVAARAGFDLGKRSMTSS
jgi:hypothetical protein